MEIATTGRTFGGNVWSKEKEVNYHNQGNGDLNISFENINLISATVKYIIPGITAAKNNIAIKIDITVGFNFLQN
jgi:hypothetical protein